MNLSLTLQRKLMPHLRNSAAIIGLSVAVSTALDNLLLAIVLLGLFFSAPQVWRITLRNPVARAAMLLFALLAVGVSYGDTTISEALGKLGKYIDLAFVPLFMLMFTNGRVRVFAERAYMAGMALTLLLSYLIGLQLLGIQPWMSDMATVDNPVVFHSHITQNNMMAYAAFLALLKCRDALSKEMRVAWASYAILAMANVLFMVQGRTGYLILLVLLCWFAWVTWARRAQLQGKPWGWKQGATGLSITILLIASAYIASPRLHDRMSLVAQEFQAWHPNEEIVTSSAGTRLNFYYNAVQIFAKHPILGVGTGGFEAAFTEQIKDTDLLTTPNPHNEYLLIAAQTGAIGLALLLYLFYTVWRTAPRLESNYLQDAARGLVLAYMINCALNSALHDHADGLFFAWMVALLFSGISAKQHA